jgi:hypothetical protein
LGLLAPHLLVSVGNRHYFIGNDFNIYEYSGGTYKRQIGHNIRDSFKNEIDFRYTRRCWMAIGANTSRLWIFYIPEGKEYIAKAYGMDLKTGAWMQRDFTHVWTDSGITSVINIGAQSYTVGDTYQQAVDSGETYSTASATTYRDVLQTIMVDERLTMGDSEGNIYQYDPDLNTDNEESVPSYFVTKIFDYGLPDIFKWLDGFTVVAKGEKLVVSYRTDNFDTEDEGWNDFDPVDLTDGYQQHSFFFNETCLQIQFKFSNYQGSSFRIREFKLHAPTIEDSL